MLESQNGDFFLQIGWQQVQNHIVNISGVDEVVYKIYQQVTNAEEMKFTSNFFGLPFTTKISSNF